MSEWEIMNKVRSFDLERPLIINNDQLFIIDATHKGGIRKFDPVQGEEPDYEPTLFTRL